jgi:hypothetical protein
MLTHGEANIAEETWAQDSRRIHQFTQRIEGMTRSRDQGGFTRRVRWHLGTEIKWECRLVVRVRKSWWCLARALEEEERIQPTSRGMRDSVCLDGRATCKSMQVHTAAWNNLRWAWLGKVNPRRTRSGKANMRIQVRGRQADTREVKR